MRIVIAGGSGLIGRALSSHLLGNGHDVTILSRSAGGEPTQNRPTVVAWNPNGSSGPWAHAIDAADAVVNLAGAGIADKRWTSARKALLKSSRVLATRSLVRAIEASRSRPATFIHGSAVGYYGASLDPRPLDESQPPGDDFLGHLAAEWEAEAKPVEQLGCRLAIVRTGIVLDARGGALPQMALPFKLFGGGPMASGNQVLSWIHIDDWTSLVTWLLTTPGVAGPFNGTAPNPATSREFASAIGRALNRPSWFPVPAFVLRVVVGGMADVALVNGQSVVPAAALRAGFRFAHPELNEALRHAFSLGPRT